MCVIAVYFYLLQSDIQRNIEFLFGYTYTYNKQIVIFLVVWWRPMEDRRQKQDTPADTGLSSNMTYTMYCI